MIHIWDVDSGRCMYVLRGHTICVNSVAYAPNGAALASGSYDNTIRLWEAADGRCLAILYLTERGWVAYTPGGRYKFGGDLDGSFWHTINPRRYVVGDLDDVIPGLRTADDELFVD